MALRKARPQGINAFTGHPRPRPGSRRGPGANTARIQGTLKPRDTNLRHRTAEQRAAFTQIRELARSKRLRVTADPEGFPIIPARYGQIEWRHRRGRMLAAYTDHVRLFQRLLAVSGIRRRWVGDREMRIVFPIGKLPHVARLLQARRRKPGHRKGRRNLVQFR